MVQKMTLKEPIQFEPRKIVYIRINYIDLPKRCSFIITAIYLAATHIVLDNNTLKIAILANSTKKRLELNKNTRLKTIYKYINTIYIITNIIKTFITIAIVSSILSNLFSIV